MMNVNALADQYGRLKEQADDLEAQIKATRQDIIDTGKQIVIGDIFRVEVVTQEFRRFDSTSAKRFLTSKQIGACMNVSSGHLVRCKKRPTVSK